MDLDIAWMIDQSHNIKPKVAAMIQTACSVQEIFAKALCLDRDAVRAAQDRNDVIGAEDTLKRADNTDVTDLLTRVREQMGVEADPLEAYRRSDYEQTAARQRTVKRKALGIEEGGSYA
jgi:L-rhamnose isomerase/sugar isomerase